MQRRLWRVTRNLLAASLLLAGCGSRMQETYGSESHFLTACDDTCGGGLSCIDQRCTRPCDEQRDCKGLNADAVCVGSDQAVTDETPGGVCDLGSAAPCEEGGLHYALGDEWACSDGCNTCYCTEDGVESTAIACVATCEDNGTVYQLGDAWQCSDGCGTCSCTEDGISTSLLLCVTTCEYEGMTYAPGDAWQCSDGCNTCTCSEDGSVTTTDIACAPTCEYEGMTYASGDEWQCSDGCNTCTCSEDGSVINTDMACTRYECSEDGVEYRVGETVDLGDGVTCVCIATSLLGECTGLPDDGSPTGEPTDGGPTPDPNDRTRCYLPPDSGDCDAAEPAIYFDAKTGQCRMFLWSECGGNANRFDSLGDCMDACAQDAN